MMVHYAVFRIYLLDLQENIFNVIIVRNFIDIAPVPLAFMKMGENEPCPSGTEITTIEECESALKQATQLEIYPARITLQSGSWGHVPYQCSDQYEGDEAFHWNTNGNGKLNNYRMICHKGTY